MSELSSALPDQSVTLLLTVLALAAVALPFLRGAKLCLQAWAATTRSSPGDLRSGAASRTAKGTVEPMAMLLMRVLRKSIHHNDQTESHPPDFIFDAGRQYVMHEYQSHYSSLISMYASLLPPIGFVGTTGGMLILFLSMHLSDSSLELGGLAVALSSSVFALVAFSVLEGFKVRLYRRLLLCLGDVQDLFERAESSATQPSPASASAPAAAAAR
jgi:hypothetical protein